MNGPIENTKENTRKYRKKNCGNCAYCFVKYVENGTKSYCDIDGEEVNPDTQSCKAHSFTN